MIALPGGVGSPEVTKEAHVLVISLDIDTSCSGRLEKNMNYLQKARESLSPLQNKEDLPDRPI